MRLSICAYPLGHNLLDFLSRQRINIQIGLLRYRQKLRMCPGLHKRLAQELDADFGSAGRQCIATGNGMGVDDGHLQKRASLVGLRKTCGQRNFGKLAMS